MTIRAKKVIVVLQARTNSSRLPAKVLLPIKNIPIVVLAATRAGNSGIPVLVVTSREETDDSLATLLEENHIDHYRGDLDNTLQRFVAALQIHDDKTIIIRLTADNVVPDGHFLDQMLLYFTEHELHYLTCSGSESGLPYGFSAEITYLEHLREADRCVDSDFDREHVTPYISTKFGITHFQTYKHLKLDRYRCTIDTFEDYLNVQKLFSKHASPQSIASIDLANELKDIQTPPSENIKTLILGGAQLGLEYGIANTTGKLTGGEAVTLIQHALTSGVENIDTARDYGESEALIGTAISGAKTAHPKVITKLTSLEEFDSLANDTISARVELSVVSSCRALNCRTLDYLLLHRIKHRHQRDGLVWKMLLRLRSEGLIRSLGASVQSPGELESVLQDPDVELIQLPLNILDNRWTYLISQILEQKEKRNLVIHARSALLQGLLLSENQRLWVNANCPNPETTIRWLDDMATRLGRSKIDLCLTYIRSQQWIDGIIVGADNLGHLDENIGLFSSTLLDIETLDQIDMSRPKQSIEFLDPSKWKT